MYFQILIVDSRDGYKKDKSDSLREVILKIIKILKTWKNLKT